MESAILSFEGQGGKTVYNPTAPFKYNGRSYMGVRVESLESELDSKTMFAYKQSKSWMIDTSLPSLPLQDPSLIQLGNSVLLVGVHVEDGRANLIGRTDFYYGPEIDRLEHIASGPWDIKGIRLIDLGDRLGVFTRPQLGEWGKGKIGYLEICSLDELKGMSETDWHSAKILEGLFNKDEWGGVNQVVKLSEDMFGIIGHVAHAAHDTGANGELRKHYYAMSFVFNISTKTYSDYKIIAQRSDFPPSQSKRSPELDDILFPAGIANVKNSHNVDLYAGISDYCCGKIRIPNPFLNIRIP